jgi:hydrogenase-4 component E
MKGIAFDLAHLLAGALVLVSFMLLYQNRLYSLLNVFALQAVVLTLSVAWQAYIQRAPHLYITAAIALAFKAIVIPIALHRIIARLGIHREVENVVGLGPTMIAAMALVALSMVVMLRVNAGADPLAREDLAFALSVVMLGLLMMVTRSNAVSQVVGFMSLENGLIRRRRREGHAAGGGDQRRFLGVGRLHCHRRLPVSHPRTFRHCRH